MRNMQTADDLGGMEDWLGAPTGNASFRDSTPYMVYSVMNRLGGGGLVWPGSEGLDKVSLELLALEVSRHQY